MTDSYRKKLPENFNIKNIIEDEYHQLLTIKEVAYYLRISPYTVFRFARDANFPRRIKLSSNCVRFDKNEILTWLNNCREEKRCV